MKQTAVEWFLENLRNLIKESELTDMRPSEFDAREMELLEQANEMFEQQIKDAYQTSHISMMTAEQYYNETYNQ
jgi:predicted DNA binding CopG/RHH family protein